MKSMNDEYRSFLVKKKLMKKNDIKKNKDIEEVIVDSIVDTFKKNQTHQLGKFGQLKKTRKMIDSKMESTVEFVPSEDYMSKAVKRYLFNKKSKSSRIKSNFLLLLISLIVFLLLVFGIAGFFIFKPQIISFIDNIKGQYEKDKLVKTTTTIVVDSSSDIDASIKKENPDLTNKEYHATDDKKLIIRTQAVNDTDLKEGEQRSSVVEIDGKMYDKNLYIIKKGDTLWDLAERFLFNPFLWTDIHKDNPYIINPDLIYPNYKLTIYKLKK
jgi:hypothetical protein